jgi:hypothetical protein
MKVFLCLLATSFLAVLAFGCGTEGALQPNGTITPCGGHHTDPQACGNAIFNAKVIGKVESGQTKEQVRAIMQHDPERREIVEGKETWIYMTDYGSELMTAIQFTDGKVSGLKQVPWHTD